MRLSHRNSPALTNASAPRSDRWRSKHSNPTWNQAAKIIARFGGEADFAAATGLHRVTPYRWQYSKPYGTDGLIPDRAVPIIQAAARQIGIILLDHDWLPERIHYTDSTTPSLEELMQ